MTILKKESEAPERDPDSMEEEVNGDDLLEKGSSLSDNELTGISESYAWGELAEYKLIEPTTKEQRREAHLAAQAIKDSETQETCPAKGLKLEEPKMTSHQTPLGTNP